GVQPADVTVVRGDSLAGIVGAATTASRMTLMLVTALVQALGKVREKLRRIAAHALEGGVVDVVVDGTPYVLAGAPKRALELVDLVNLAYREPDLLPPGMEMGLVEEAVFAGPGAGKHLSADHRLQVGFPSYAFSVHVPVVEIDPGTFEV